MLVFKGCTLKKKKRKETKNLGNGARRTSEKKNRGRFE